MFPKLREDGFALICGAVAGVIGLVPEVAPVIPMHPVCRERVARIATNTMILKRLLALTAPVLTTSDCRPVRFMYVMRPLISHPA
jgi:hypothetical protein